MLACARVCGSVSMRYGSSETIFWYGYRHNCIYGCLLTANKVGQGLFLFLLLLLFWGETEGGGGVVW